MGRGHRELPLRLPTSRFRDRAVGQSPRLEIRYLNDWYAWARFRDNDSLEIIRSPSGGGIWVFGDGERPVHVGASGCTCSERPCVHIDWAMQLMHGHWRYCPASPIFRTVEHEREIEWQVPTAIGPDPLTEDTFPHRLAVIDLDAAPNTVHIRLNLVHDENATARIALTHHDRGTCSCRADRCCHQEVLLAARRFLTPFPRSPYARAIVDALVDNAHPRAAHADSPGIAHDAVTLLTQWQLGRGSRLWGGSVTLVGGEALVTTIHFPNSLNLNHHRANRRSFASLADARKFLDRTIRRLQTKDGFGPLWI